MKTLIYATISMMAVAVLAGCGSKSNNNSYPYNNPYGYNQYGGGSCLPTGVPVSQALCQQYGYSFNGSTCVSPQGQVITPGSCTTGSYYGNGYTGGYGNGYTGGYGNYGGYPGYTGYSGYYYGSTTPYGYPTYIPTMPIY